MFVCPSCQTENRPTAKFCRKCGLPRPVAAESEASQRAPGPASSPAQPAASDAQAKAEPDATGGSCAAAEPPAVAAGWRASCSAGPSEPSTTRGVATMAFGAAPAQEEQEELTEEITEEEVEAEVRKAAQATVGESGNGEPAAVAPSAPEEGPGRAAETGRRGGPTCPACGSNVRATDKFCIWCGERQPMRVMPKMKRCSECRAQLPMTANFCYVCGSDVGLHHRRKVRAPAELFAEEDPELFPTFEA